MRKEHAVQIENAIQALKAKGEVNEVYFVACGGSQAVLMAGQYLFDRESNVPTTFIQQMSLFTTHLKIYAKDLW